MAESRYKSVGILDDKFYETVDFPSKKELDAISTFQIRLANFDRLDNLASKYLGSGEYWWVIALMNDLDWAYTWEEGKIIRIPVQLSDVLRLF